MKHINVFEDYGIYELGSEDELKPLLDDINIDNNFDIILNLSGCLPDYPATSQIIDVIINQLKHLPGEKKLTIKMEFNLPQETLVNWVFLGSKEIGIEDQKELILAEIKNLVMSNLLKSNIRASIIVCDRLTGVKIDEILFF